MKKPKKDKKIDIWFEGWYQDENGIERPIKKPITDTPIWAYFRQIGGSEYYAAGAANRVNEECLFIINWRDDVTNTNFIVYEGKVYDIQRIDPYEGYKDDLKIYAKLDEKATIPNR